MAKVLVCPNCSFKHPLDLLVGLETFICSNCDKKLSVPVEANQYSQKNEEPNDVDLTPKVVATSNSSNLKEQSLQGTVVVARSSASLDSKEIISQVKPEITENDREAPVRTSFKSKSIGQKIKDSNAGLKPLGLILNIVVWLLAIPSGFFVVVIIPRMFGGGFRASHFVDVITTQGLGRYKIVILLILLWSLATVVGVYLYTNLLQRIIRRKNSKSTNISN